MSKVNLKDNIWIEGFDTVVYPITALNKEEVYDVMYVGKTFQIPREIAKQIFDWGYDDLEVHFESLDEAIQLACGEKYCIIYRTK